MRSDTDPCNPLTSYAGPVLLTRINELLACVEDALEEQGRPWSGEQAYISPTSQLVADYCCPGQLSARILRTYPSDAFPAKTTALRNCTWEFATAVVVTILRCPSGLARLDKGNAPTPAQLQADADEMACDMAALKYAVECCYAHHYVLDQITPVVSQGNCFGSEMALWLDAGPDCGA